MSNTNAPWVMTNANQVANVPPERAATPSTTGILTSAIGRTDDAALVGKSENATNWNLLRLWPRQLLELVERRIVPENLAKAFFENFVATGTNAGDGWTHLDVWNDADSLRGFLVRIKDAEAGDHRPLAPGKQDRRDVAIGPRRRTAHHDCLRRGIKLDVTRPQNALAAVDAAVAKVRRIDVLVNNAVISSPASSRS
jgi:hypothetical protein